MRPLLLMSLLTVANCFGGDDSPQMNTVSAKVAKPGDEIDIAGLGLNEKNVDEVYLTDHKFDMKVKVIEQTDKNIKFRVPPFAKPGRVQILMLTKGEEPKLLEQPVYILIEEATTEVGQVKTPPPAPEAAPVKQEQEQQRDKQQ
jgi:hypothetical protein